MGEERAAGAPPCPVAIVDAMWYPRRSEETVAFVGVLVYRGAPVAKASNDGRGGAHRYSPLAGHNYADVDAALVAGARWVVAHGPEPFRSATTDLAGVAFEGYLMGDVQDNAARDNAP